MTVGLAVTISFLFGVAAGWVTYIAGPPARSKKYREHIGVTQYDTLLHDIQFQSIVVGVFVAFVTIFVILLPGDTTITVEEPFLGEDDGARYSITIYMKDGTTREFTDASYVDMKDGGLFFIDDLGRECSYLEYEVIEEIKEE